jgi:hypothetical protein
MRTTRATRTSAGTRVVEVGGDMNGNGRQQSWFSEHPWMTFFLALGVINGVVYIAGARHIPRLAPVDPMPPERDRGRYR